MNAKALFFLLALCALPLQAQQSTEGDFVIHNFRFRSGEVLPELKLHYTTYGKPATDSAGRVTNAVIVLHGTGGSGKQFVGPHFAGVLFGPGQLLLLAACAW